MTVVHETFTLQRTYAATPARVFQAWSDPDQKALWYVPKLQHELDFRAGGREYHEGRGDNGKLLAVESFYRDIVADTRIVYTSTLFADGATQTVSLTTVQLTEDGAGTLLTLTEQGTFLDGNELPEWRVQGTGDWLDRLGEHLVVSA